MSISKPYIRPIERRKAAAPVEFGAKLDLSLNEKGMARIEKMSFDAYNESNVLLSAVQRYFERTGHYPERVRKIKSTGTGLIYTSARSTESVYQDRFLEDRARMQKQIRKKGIGELLSIH